MGNGMNKILPGLYIGNFRDAKDLTQIQDNGITHIVAVHDNAKPSLEKIKYKCIDIPDSPEGNIYVHFADCINFIHRGRKEGGSVLVHCIAGVSRSCAVCAAYLLVVTNTSWSDAILAIRSARSVVNPNYGFQKQLQNFEKGGAEKVRKELISQYGELQQEDVEYIKEALRSIDPNTIASRIDVNVALGTTPTFGNYDRKRINKNSCELSEEGA